ncbi:MFS transporter [Dictyobacter aurantiacus]|uniref:MFS transporter n=1 Tax=Dictyobacter aurantiacus TaxID=1936993 RepID=A0A401ZD35_9CHLR|nr:MFS transporter [Dictyobacter aurantiacus]GCE04800.1 MFS transporter [Dictyobacter aurantiacus]
MLAILRQRNFALLWSGAFISMLGDWVLLIALPLFVYQRTGSAMATGAIVIVESVPGLLLSSIGGVFADRWDRRRIMILTDFLRALNLLQLLLLPLTNWFWLVYTAAAIESVLSQFFNPASGALIPHVVSEDQLAAANGMNAFSGQITRLLGPTLAGTLFTLKGIQSVIIADCLSYVLSGIMSLLVTLPPEKTRAALQATMPSSKALWQEWKQGLALIPRDHMLYIAFIMVAAAVLGDGIIRAISTPFLSQVAAGNALVFSWIVTAQGGGAVAGSLVIGRLNKLLHPFLLCGLSAVIISILGSIEALFFSLPVVFACTFLLGAPIMFFFVGSYTVIQQRASDEARGRILGAYSAVSACCSLAGLIISTLLTALLGVRILFALGQVGYLVGGLLALFFLRKGNIKR